MSSKRTHGLRISIGLILLAMCAALTRADVYQWEYINPADPSAGKQQSAILCPSGAGIVIGPGVNLIGPDLTQAYLPGADLSSSQCEVVDFTNAEFAQAKFNNALFINVTLSGANLTQADLSNAEFIYTDATGAVFDHANLSGMYLVDDTLVNASFRQANLTGALISGDITGADFSGATIASTSFARNSPTDGSGISLAQLYSTADYKASNLSGVRLSGN